MTIEECLVQATTGGVLDLDQLVVILRAREDNALDHLRLAASQFGLPYVEIVDEVLAQTGLGTPFTEEARLMIRNSFLAKIEELRRAQEGQ